MLRRFSTRMTLAAVLAAALAGAIMTVPGRAAAPTPSFHVTNIVSNVPGLAPLTDTNLMNPWGMSFTTSSPFWISNAGSNTSTLYNVDGTTGVASLISTLVVKVPGSPTGQVACGGLGFTVSQGGSTSKANFIFAAQDGTISAWSGGAAAVVAATGAAKSSYTGLTLGNRSGTPFLYAANFGLGQIDVYDQNFKPVTVPGGFTDSMLPPADKPYNIQSITTNNATLMYVTYRGAAGVVNVFDTDGTLMKRLATGSPLHNPWGVALAPAGFPQFGNDILVGNFNDGDSSTGAGTISAWDPTGTNQFKGLLKDAEGNPIWIDGLWALAFGNGTKAGMANVLYFTAGIDGQKDGLFGSIAAS